jgi:hypothetical protein
MRTQYITMYYIALLALQDLDELGTAVYERVKVTSDDDDSTLDLKAREKKNEHMIIQEALEVCLQIANNAYELASRAADNAKFDMKTALDEVSKAEKIIKRVELEERRARNECDAVEGRPNPDEDLPLDCPFATWSAEMRELMESNLAKFVKDGQYRAHIDNDKRVFKGTEDSIMMVVLLAKIQLMRDLKQLKDAKVEADKLADHAENVKASKVVARDRSSRKRDKQAARQPKQRHASISQPTTPSARTAKSVSPTPATAAAAATPGKLKQTTSSAATSRSLTPPPHRKQSSVLPSEVTADGSNYFDDVIVNDEDEAAVSSSESDSDSDASSSDSDNDDSPTTTANSGATATDDAARQQKANATADKALQRRRSSLLRMKSALSGGGSSSGNAVIGTDSATTTGGNSSSSTVVAARLHDEMRRTLIQDSIGKRKSIGKKQIAAFIAGTPGSPIAGGTVFNSTTATTNKFDSDNDDDDINGADSPTTADNTAANAGTTGNAGTTSATAAESDDTVHQEDTTNETAAAEADS